MQADLPFEMYSEGYHNIVNIDFSKNAIAEMEKKAIDTHGLQFLEMDILNMTFPRNTFDVVIDKATLDSVLCAEESSRLIQTMLKQIHRVLKPYGMFMMLSYAKSQLRLNYLKKKDYSWDITVEMCRKWLIILAVILRYL